MVKERLAVGDRVRVVKAAPGPDAKHIYTDGDTGVVIREGVGKGGCVRFDKNNQEAYVFFHEVEVLPPEEAPTTYTYKAGEELEIVVDHPLPSNLRIGDRVTVASESALLGGHTLAVRSKEGDNHLWLVRPADVRRINQKESTVAEEKQSAPPKAGDLVRLTKDVPENGSDVPRDLVEGQYVVVLAASKSAFKGRRIEDNDDEDDKHFILRIEGGQYEVRQRS
jgi:hypothetical protein